MKKPCKKQQHEPGWKCPKCKKTRGADGHDPCLGGLPGVLFACCGHGKNTGGYVYFENGVTLRGKFDVESKVSDEQLRESKDLSERQKRQRVGPFL